MSRGKGIFITFEGAEGSGKSTQIKRAAAYLRRKGFNVLVLREPGGTRIGEAIRKIILNPAHREMFSETELLLYLAARAQIVREKIRPALSKGRVVICDRFEDSTLAYQGFGRGLSLKTIERVSRELVREKNLPDLTFILDLSPRRGMRRGGRRDRIEKASFRFHEKVRRGFLTLARKDPKRYRALDGAASIEFVAKKIRTVLDDFFRAR